MLNRIKHLKSRNVTLSILEFSFSSYGFSIPDEYQNLEFLPSSFEYKIN